MFCRLLHTIRYIVDKYIYNFEIQHSTYIYVLNISSGANKINKIEFLLHETGKHVQTYSYYKEIMDRVGRLT